MKAALDARTDPALVIMGRTGTRGGGPSASSLDDCVVRAMAYEATGVDALFFTGLKTRKNLRRFPRRPCCRSFSQPPGRTGRSGFLISQRVRIALQGHTPFAAATQAVYDTLKACATVLHRKTSKDCSHRNSPAASRAMPT